MGRFSRGGSFIPEERACFLPLDFAVVAGGKAVEWMFANTPIIRIFAAAYATNSASQRVLVKAGFRHVGTFRKAFFKNGAFVDGCYYELLKDENE